MKLFSLMILYKEETTGKATFLKSASELSSFSFFYKKSADEFMHFSGKLFAERSKVPSRNSMTEDKYRLCCYVRPDNLAGVSVTDLEYDDRVSFTMLSKILDEFAQKVHVSRWSQIHHEKDCDFTGLSELLQKWQNPREADALMRVQDEVDETKVVLHNTMQSLLDRGEQLSDLVRASENLSDQSKMFYTQARKMNNSCCNWA